MLQNSLCYNNRYNVGEKPHENVLNTNLEVANRYHVSSEVVVLDHRW